MYPIKCTQTTLYTHANHCSSCTILLNDILYSALKTIGYKIGIPLRAMIASACVILLRRIAL